MSDLTPPAVDTALLQHRLSQGVIGIAHARKWLAELRRATADAFRGDAGVEPPPLLIGAFLALDEDLAKVETTLRGGEDGRARLVVTPAPADAKVVEIGSRRLKAFASGKTEPQDGPGGAA